MARESHVRRETPVGKPEHPGDDETFKRHGPEPPENDSGPSAEGDEMFSNPDSTVRNVEPEEQVD